MLDVPVDHRDLVLRLLRHRLPHCAAIAFGSRVGGWSDRRGAKPFSDLDIALWALSPGDDRALANLRADLEESTLPWRVDLSDAADLPAALRDRVLREGVWLCGRLVPKPQAA